MFDYWTVLAEPYPEIKSCCGDWLRTNLRGYTGMVNFETIDARIIEVHLRFSDQWPDLYGAGWSEALVRLYRDGVWTTRTATGGMATAWSCSARTASSTGTRIASWSGAPGNPRHHQHQITFHEASR